MATDLVFISIAVTLGVALGSVRVRGMRLGISGVLFSALLLGQLGARVDGEVLSTLRDFSLIIFVYAVGLQVGPGFLASLRADGRRLNALMLLIPLLGAGLSVLSVTVGRLPHAAGPGLYAGALTCTPGLGAAQDSLRTLHASLPDHGASAIAMAGVAYTLTYPIGLLGPILVIAALRRLFRVGVGEELARLVAIEAKSQPPIAWADIEVTQPNQAGISMSGHPLLEDGTVKITRLLRDGTVVGPGSDTTFRVGDVIRAVGPANSLDRLIAATGQHASVNIDHFTGNVTAADLVVTVPRVLRRSLGELDFGGRFAVNVAWVNRSGVFLMPVASLRLQFGDQVRFVGDAAGLKSVEAEVGNAKESLNHTNMVPMFLGIALGVLIGSIPIAIPGLHASLRIGLTGGAMFAAIGLSQLGNIGSIVWYMPVAANQLFRDFGMAVFLACIGLGLGDHFVQHVSQSGPSFLVWGIIITLVPPLVLGIVARLVFRMNFVRICGLLAGGMCCVPALAFANDMTRSDKPAVAYSAVSPLAEFSAILISQALVIFVG